MATSTVRTLTYWMHGVALAGAVTSAFLGAEGRTTALVETDEELAALEAGVSTDASRLPELAAAYLDRQQPGLAEGALDRVSERESPEIVHLRGRVALAQGRVADALRLQRLALATCEVEASTCPGWLWAKTTRQIELLGALEAAGVEDPQRQPAAAREAFARGMREVRLVASL